MFKCSLCINSDICTEVCQPLENYLEQENGIAGYTLRHIRRKEKPRDPSELQGIAMELLSHRYGKRNIKYIPEKA